jgi:DNA mismatch endonuclease (patch repair protein)
MRGNKREDTRPEAALRSALHRRGYRFRIHLRIDTDDVRVRPDIVFTRRRLAVFIDGCYWHSCPIHGNQPRANASYWHWKLATNKARDARVNVALRRSGWTVLRLWEHVPAAEAADAVAAVLADD